MILKNLSCLSRCFFVSTSTSFEGVGTLIYLEEDVTPYSPLQGVLSPEVCPLGKLNGAVSTMGIQANSNPSRSDYLPVSSPGFFGNDGLQSQDSFGMWMNYIMTETPDSAHNAALESSIPYFGLSSVAMNDLPSSSPEIIFSITDVAPAWAFSTEKTKVFFFFISLRYFIF